MSKTFLDVNGLRELARASSHLDTQAAFIDVALDWASQANDELVRLKARVAELEAQGEPPETAGAIVPLPRFVPDHECAQGKCANTTTGCFGECQIKSGRLAGLRWSVVTADHGNTLPVAGAPKAWIVENSNGCHVMFYGPDRPKGFDGWSRTKVVDVYTADQIRAARKPLEEENEQLRASGLELVTERDELRQQLAEAQEQIVGYREALEPIANGLYGNIGSAMVVARETLLIYRELKKEQS